MRGLEAELSDKSRATERVSSLAGSTGSNMFRMRTPSALCVCTVQVYMPLAS